MKYVLVFFFSLLIIQISAFAEDFLRVAYINLKIPYYKAGGVNTAQNQMVEALQQQENVQAYYVSPDRPASGQHSAELNFELKRRVEELVDNRIKTFSLENQIIVNSEVAYWKFENGNFSISSGTAGQILENEIPISHSARSLTEDALDDFVRWIVENKIDVLHCQYPTEIDVTLEVAERVRALGIPIKTVYQDHSTTALTVIDESIRKVKADVSDYGDIAKKVYNTFFGPNFHKFDTVFCSTGIAAENYFKMGLHDNISLVPISIKSNATIADKSALRLLLDKALVNEFQGRAIANNPDVDIFVLAGRIDPRKNVDKAIEAIAKYKNLQKGYDNPRPFQLILMGPYQMKEEPKGISRVAQKIRSLFGRHSGLPEPMIWDLVKKYGLEKNVLLTGVYNQEDFLNVLDYYKLNGNRITNLHFSKLETFGMAVREALLKKVPVVGTDTHNFIMNDFLRFIPSVEDVFLLSDSVDDVASNLERLLLQNEYDEQFSVRKLEIAANEIKRFFSPEQVASSAIEAYGQDPSRVPTRNLSPREATSALIDGYRRLVNSEALNSCLGPLLMFSGYF